MSTYRLRGKLNFPATVTAGAGFSVSKSNGVWNIGPNWATLGEDTTLASQDTKYVWEYDSASDTYYRVSLTTLVSNLPAGPTGATGAAGATGPAGPTGVHGTPAANTIATFYDATNIQGVAITGLVKGNGASAPTAAAAGTDYQAPIGTFSGIVKGNGANTLALATAGTDYVKPDTTSAFTAGYTATSASDGTKSSGTYTPDPATGNFKYITANGAFTLAPPASECSIVIEVLNGASAGAITTSGFTKVDGAYATTNAYKYIFNILKSKNYSYLNIVPLQ